jgi:hypothetical protein
MPTLADPPRDPAPHEPIPFWQRVFDNVYLLLVLGLLVMLLVYTAWGMLEIYTMPQATLP